MKKSVCAILAFAFLLIVILALPIHAEESTPLATLSPARAATLLLGKAIGKEEENYLRYYGTPLQYSEPTHASVTLVGNTLTASPCLCRTATGGDLLWAPYEATGGDAVFPFTESGGVYVATLPLGFTDTVKVEYRASLALNEEEISALVSLPYEIGEAEAARLTAYETYLAANEAYLAYLARKEAYDRYEEEYAAYLVKKAEYDAYVQDKAAYDAAKASYDAYLLEEKAYEAAYDAYISLLRQSAEDEAAYTAYLSYTQALSDCRQRLSIMAYILNEDYRVFSALTGSAVMTVLEHRNELVALGCSAADLETAATATTTLQTLLTQYAALTEESEKYQFYVENYAALSQNFADLYRTLLSLFKNHSEVRLALDSKDRLYRYMQFMAQLYVVSCALDDTAALSEDWEISTALAYKKETRSLQEALGGLSPILSDLNKAVPKETALPSPVSASLPPTLPDVPTPPTKIEKPNPPSEVTETAEPIAPSLPGEEVKKPTVPSELPSSDGFVLALGKAVKAGTLTEHRYEGNGKLPLSCTVEISPLAGDGYVALYREDGHTLLAVYQTTDASLLSYTPPDYTQDETLYTFSTLQDEHKTPLCLTQANAAAHPYVYAAFTSSPRTYTVRFKNGAEEKTVLCRFGDLPTCPYASLYDYTLDRELTPVTEDASYTLLSAKPKTYEITLSLYKKTITQRLQAGEMPDTAECPAYYWDGDAFFVLNGWSPALQGANGDAVYEAQYEQKGSMTRKANGDYLFTASGYTQEIGTLLSLAASENRDLQILFPDGSGVMFLVKASNALAGTDLFVTLQKENGGLWSGRVVISRENGENVAFPDGVKLLLPYDGGERLASCASLTVLGSSNGKTLPLTYRNGTLIADLLSSSTLALTESFSITCRAEGMGAIRLLTAKASPSSLISFEVCPAAGYVLSSLSVKTEGGKTVSVNGNTLTMPRDNAVIAAVFTPRRYTVRFEVNGTLYEERSYALGEDLILPAPVQSDNPQYVFSGWSPSPDTVVTKDATYYAIFTYRTIEETDDRYGGLSPLVIGGMIGAFVLVFSLICIALLPKKKRKRKKNR